MKIKTTLGEIVQAMPVLKKLSEQDLPIRDSCKLAKLFKAAALEAEIYDRERIKLCEKYGEKASEGDRYEIKEIGAFNDGFSQLIAVETELEAEPVKLSGSIKLTAAEIISAENFIIFEED